MGSPELWGMLVLAAAATYASRLLGVVLAGRVTAAGAVLDWIACIAYALLAGLVSRMLILPIGPLAQTPALARVGAVALALFVFFVTRRNILAGVAAGTIALALVA